jgi:hypothetical protein
MDLSRGLGDVYKRQGILRGRGISQIAGEPRKTAHSCGLITLCIIFLEPEMGNKIVTEADRKFTPPLPALPGVTLRTHGRGQRVSLERGVATRSKKNPGKRSKKGG